jgi:hypothetical protein
MAERADRAVGAAVFPWTPPKAERVGLGMPVSPGSDEWELWMAACRAVLKIAPRTWSAYLLGWQLRRLYDAGVIVGDSASQWERIVEEAELERPRPEWLTDG